MSVQGIGYFTELPLAALFFAHFLKLFLRQYRQFTDIAKLKSYQKFLGLG